MTMGKARQGKAQVQTHVMFTESSCNRKSKQGRLHLLTNIRDGSKKIANVMYELTLFRQQSGAAHVNVL